MANVKTTLDTRRKKSDGTYNIIYRITHNNKVYTINSGTSILHHYWDYEHSEIVKQHPNSKLLNLKLLKGYFKIEKAILTMDDEFSIEQLRNIVKGNTSNSSQTFKNFAQKLIKQMIDEGRTGNALTYETGVNRLMAFCGDEITFDKIDYKLLTEFIHHLKVGGLKINSISNYLRSIRAIYNKAIKYKLVDRASYPFYDISIKSERTAKRAISRENIKSLLAIRLHTESVTKRSLDYFMLSFYLRGMSFTDLAYLKPTNIIDGRLYYKRRKTSKNYNIKLFTPSKAIINNLHQIDDDYLLPVLPNNIVEDSLAAKKIIKQWIKTTNKYLRRLSQELKCETSITTYSSRHSFASIAKHMGYSNEMIAEALGHEYGNKVTNIYLESFNANKIDAMHYDIIVFEKS